MIPLTLILESRANEWHPHYEDLWQIMGYAGLMDCPWKRWLSLFFHQWIPSGVIIRASSFRCFYCESECQFSLPALLLTEPGESQYHLAGTYSPESWILFLRVGWTLQNNLRQSSCCTSKPQPLIWVLRGRVPWVLWNRTLLHTPGITNKPGLQISWLPDTQS